MSRRLPDRPNVAIVTSPFSAPAGPAILSNYIEQLKPITGQMYIVTEKSFDTGEEDVHIIGVAAPIAQREPLLIRAAKFLLTQLATSFSLLKVPRNVKVIIFQIGTALYLLPILSAKLLRKKIIVFAVGRPSHVSKVEYGHIGVIFSTIFRIIENTIFSLSDSICALSKGGIHLLDLNKYERKIAISGAQYINTDIYRINKKSENRRDLVGYTGRLDLQKGVLNFAKAIPLVLKERENTEFLIAGQGSISGEIEQVLGDNNLHHKVKLTGWIPQDEFPQLLSELKLFVLPSYEEGLPGTVQQAMACGAVVLATRVGGVPDLIKDNETGFLLEDNLPGTIAENIIRALNHPKLAEIVQNARKLIEQEYSYEIMVKKCKHLLDELTRDTKC